MENNNIFEEYDLLGLMRTAMSEQSVKESDELDINEKMELIQKTFSAFSEIEINMETVENENDKNLINNVSDAISCLDYEKIKEIFEKK